MTLNTPHFINHLRKASVPLRQYITPFPRIRIEQLTIGGGNTGTLRTLNYTLTITAVALQCQQKVYKKPQFFKVSFQEIPTMFSKVAAREIKSG